MKFRDAIERIFWTAVAAAGAAVTGAALFDVESWRAAAMAATAAAIDAVLVIARWRLSVLPNPGAGLPGLPVEPKPIVGAGYVPILAREGAAARRDFERASAAADELFGDLPPGTRPRNEDGS